MRGRSVAEPGEPIRRCHLQRSCLKSGFALVRTASLVVSRPGSRAPLALRGCFVAVAVLLALPRRVWVFARRHVWVPDMGRGAGSKGRLLAGLSTRRSSAAPWLTCRSPFSAAPGLC